MRTLFCLFLFLLGAFITVPVVADSYSLTIPTVDTVSDGHHSLEAEPEEIAREIVLMSLYLSEHETRTPFARLVLAILPPVLWRPPMIKI